MIKIDVSWKSILLFWSIAVGLWVIATFADVLLILFTAILLATFISPVVTALNRHGLPRWLATLFIYFDLLAVAGVVVYLAAPLAVNETAALLARLPGLTVGVYEYLTSLPGFSEFSSQLPSSAELANRIILQLAALLESLRDIFFAVTTILIGAVVVLVAAYFFTVDEHLLDRLGGALIPMDKRARTLELLRASGNRMRGWVVGQLIVTAYFVATFSLGLWLLGVPYPLSLGFIAGVLEIVPFIGGAIGTVLAMIVAFAQDPLLALWVLVLHLIISSVEAHILVPYIYARAFRVHPVVVILALVVGGKLLGLMGALLAVPAAAALQVLLEELYIRDVIKAQEDGAGERGAA